MCFDCGFCGFCSRKQKLSEYGAEEKSVIEKAKTGGDTDFYDVEEAKSDYHSDTGLQFQGIQDTEIHYNDDLHHQQGSHRNKKYHMEPPHQQQNDDIKYYLKQEKLKEDQQSQSTTSNVLQWLGSSSWWPFSDGNQQNQNQLSHSQSNPLHSKHRSSNQLNKMQSHPEYQTQQYINVESDDEDNKQNSRCLPKLFNKKSQENFEDLLNSTGRESKLLRKSKNKSDLQNSFQILDSNTQMFEKRLVGLTVKHKDEVEPVEIHEKYGPIYKQCWSSIDPETFNIRSKEYIMNRQKCSSEKPIYELKAVDIYTFESKQNNIAKLFKLPKPYENYPVKVEGKPINQIIPPVLVVTMMIPMYPPTLFNPVTNGKGHQIVYFGVLSQDYDPNDSPDGIGQFNLVRDFIKKIQENDVIFSQKMKLIPRVVNIEEWVNDAKVSKYYSQIMHSYNDKPFLTRPNHKFFVEENQYWEIDFDLHVFSYFPRSVFNQFWNKINNMLFETAFVIQGDGFDELPERLLIAARVYRSNFSQEHNFYQNNTDVQSFQLNSQQSLTQQIQLPEKQDKNQNEVQNMQSQAKEQQQKKNE